MHFRTHFTDKRMSISESYFDLCSFTDMTNKSFAVEFTITDEFQIRTCTYSLRFTGKVNITFFIKRNSATVFVVTGWTSVSGKLIQWCWNIFFKLTGHCKYFTLWNYLFAVSFSDLCNYCYSIITTDLMAFAINQPLCAFSWSSSSSCWVGLWLPLKTICGLRIIRFITIFS